MQVSHMYVRLNMHLISWHKSDLNLLILQQSLTNKYSVQYDLTADFVGRLTFHCPCNHTLIEMI